MITEKNSAVVALSDESLAQVTAGYEKYHDAASNRYYLWTGDLGCNEKYVCPNCGRAVSAGFWSITFSCKPCGASWYYEKRLKPNLGAGGWKEVTKAEYETSGANPLRR